RALLRRARSRARPRSRLTPRDVASALALGARPANVHGGDHRGSSDGGRGGESAMKGDAGPRRVVAELPWNWESDLMPAGGTLWCAVWRELGAWVEWYTRTFEL